MSSLLEKSEDNEETNSKKIAVVQPTPFLAEPRDDGQATIDANYELIEGFPTLVMPAMGIAEMQTLTNLTALYKLPPTPHFFVDGLALSEQPTWIIPVLPGLAHAQQLTENARGAADYISLIRNLVKNSGIYALSSLAGPAVSLGLAPFLTRFLSHSDYGALIILTTVIALLAGVTQLGIGDAFFRTYNYDYESQNDRLDVLSTIVLLLLLLSLPTALIAIFTAPWLATLLLKDSSLGDLVRIAALVILVQNLSVPGLAWLRAENRAALFSILSILNLLVSLGANILLVGVAHMGIAGSLLATGGGYGLIVICTLPVILLRAGFHLRLDIARGLLAFGLPHVVNLLSGWVLQLSDRYLLGHLGSLSQTASYAVAYSLGGVLSSVIITPFSLAWWSLMFPIAKRDDAKHVFQLIFRWFGMVLLFATFGLSRFGVIVLNLFFPPGYHSAAPIIPIIAGSILFNGIFVVVAVGTSIQRKTWLAALFITFSAALNVGLNIVLIPLYGPMGAALSTLIAYIALALIAYCGNQLIYPVPFEVGRFSIGLLVGIALYIGSAFLAQYQAIYIAWSIHIAALILYGGCLLVLAKLPAIKLLKIVAATGFIVSRRGGFSNHENIIGS